MEQHTLKNVNNYFNTSIYSYLETSGGPNCNLYLNVVHFSTPVLIRHLCFPALMTKTCCSILMFTNCNVKYNILKLHMYLFSF